MKDPRRFSLEDNFMHYSIDDLFYGCLRSLSTARPIGNNKYEEYLLKSTFVKEKEIIASICNCTTRTVNNKMNRLIEQGLVKETELVLDGQRKYICYTFPFDSLGLYKIIERDMVRYLIETRNGNVIKIYLYLLNRSQMHSDYIFTIKELKSMMGYSDLTKSANNLIKNVLLSLKREGIIDYDVIIEKQIDDFTGETIKKQFMKLKFIAKSTKELSSFSGRNAEKSRPA